MAAYVDNYLDRGALQYLFQKAAKRGDRYLVHCRERRHSFGGRGGIFDEYVHSVKNAGQILDCLGSDPFILDFEGKPYQRRYTSEPEKKIILNIFDTRRKFNKQMDWQEEKRGNVCHNVPTTPEILSQIVTPRFGRAYAAWLQKYDETHDRAQAAQAALEDYPQGWRRFVLETLGM